MRNSAIISDIGRRQCMSTIIGKVSILAGRYSIIKIKNKI